MVLVSITSSEFSHDLTLVENKIVKKILVYDNSRYAGVEKSNNNIVIWLKGINGSYAARNEALKFVDEGELVLLMDDDIKVISFPNLEPEDDILYAPNIVLDGEPSTKVELWYKNYAFDQEKFVNKEGFAPTITWLFKYNGQLFDSSLMSGGDVEYSRHFKSIEIVNGFVISTKLRGHNKILLKFQRQVAGLALRKSYLWMFSYMLKLFAFGSGGKARSFDDYVLRYIVGFRKGYYVGKLLFKWKKRHILAKKGNKIEVNA